MQGSTFQDPAEVRWVRAKGGGYPIDGSVTYPGDIAIGPAQHLYVLEVGRRQWNFWEWFILV